MNIYTQIKDHTHPNKTIHGHKYLYKTIHDHTRPYIPKQYHIYGHAYLYKTINDHAYPNKTIHGHTYPYKTIHGNTYPYKTIHRGAKRGGAREHSSQKEMDRIDHGRRIWDKCTALVMISKNMVIYPTFTDGPKK